MSAPAGSTAIARGADRRNAHGGAAQRRAERRVDAERVLRAWALHARATVAILRVPGIYAPDRLPLKRLEQGTPALLAGDDVYTNHIHADDLARIARWRCSAAGRSGSTTRSTTAT
jgi:nucleoside-diphosphate-sugar epimerase